MIRLLPLIALLGACSPAECVAPDYRDMSEHDMGMAQAEYEECREQ